MAMKVRYTVINGEVISETRGASRRTRVPDANGNTIALLDDTGTSTDTFVYWPYGTVKNRTGTTPTKLQFGGAYGYYADSAARIYVRARVYATAYARWLTVDSFWPSQPRYSYCSQSPTSRIDPSGHMIAPLLVDLMDFPENGDLIQNCCLAMQKPFSGLNPFYFRRSLVNAKWFRDQVKNKGPWDFKQQSASFQDYGNFHFGFVGACMGFSLDLLQKQAGKAQIAAGTSRDAWQHSPSPVTPVGWMSRPLAWPYGDDPRDSGLIADGYALASKHMAALRKLCQCYWQPQPWGYEFMPGTPLPHAGGGGAW